MQQVGLKKRKKTGGKKRAYRSKRRREMGSPPVETRFGELEMKKKAGRSRIIKLRLISADMVNVSDPRTGKTERLRITEVVRNPANVDYNRRRVITRGTIIRTEKGLAQIISHPGQNGLLNAVTYME